MSAAVSSEGGRLRGYSAERRDFERRVRDLIVFLLLSRGTDSDSDCGPAPVRLNHASLMTPLSALSSRHLFVHIGLLPAFLRRTMSTKTYRDAVDHLNSLQSNAAVLAMGERLNEPAIPIMIESLGRIGYSVSRLHMIP